MDRATDCLPSRVQDWLYCCEPSSTRGCLVFGSTVTTSRSRTMPVAGGVGPVGLARFTGPVVLPEVAAVVVAVVVPERFNPPWVAPALPEAALTMMSAN